MIPLLDWRIELEFIKIWERIEVSQYWTLRDQSGPCTIGDGAAS
jgi:hypothetical protein